MKKKVIITVFILLIIILGIIFIFKNPKSSKEKYDGKRNVSTTTAVKKDEIKPSGYNYTISEAMNIVSLNSSPKAIKESLNSSLNKTNSSLYKIKYSDAEVINIQLAKDNSILYIDAQYDLRTLINENVTFKENKKLMKDYMNMTYDEVKSLLNADGVKNHISKDNTEYTWVSNNGEFVKATFDKDNKCVSYTGILKYA